MKNTLLAISGLFIALPAFSDNLADQLQSQGPQFFNPTLAAQKIEKQAPQTRADESTNWFGYCAGYNTCLQLPASGTFVLEEAIYITPEMSENWLGNKITKVSIGYGESSNLDVLVYITKDLYGEPEYMEEFTLKEPGGWNEVTLSTPYTIDGEEFFVGYQTKARGYYDAPLGIDGLPSTLGLGDIYGVNGEYSNLGATNGSACLRFEMEGPVKPEMEALTDLMFYGELISAGQPFETNIVVMNLGNQSLTDAVLTCTLDGEAVDNLKVSMVSGYGDYIPFGTLGMINVSASVPAGIKGENLPLEVSLTGLVSENGETLPLYDHDFSALVTVSSQTFPQKFVVEEYTGTWCGWCPRGIVGMAYMKENYGDKGFIGIAGHNDDAMALRNYQTAIAQYNGGGFPSSAINRKYFPIEPSWNALEYYFTQMMGASVSWGIELEAEYSAAENVIKATASVISGVDVADAACSIAFFVTEDNVGPYVQTNYFSGRSGEEGMAEWEAAGSKVPTYYNEVARVVMDPFGIEGSVPSELTALTPYPYSVDLPVDNITNINNCHVIAVLINHLSGEIINADEVGIYDAGVESLYDDMNSGELKVYNLQGVKVMQSQDASELRNLPKGIYIVNGKKILVK